MSEKVLVTRATLPPFEEYINEIKGIWDSHWLTNMGEKHRTFQSELETYMKVPNVELMVNGHMALEMVLQAYDLKGEVITTPFTFASTTHAIVRNGLTPVFCDIKQEDQTIDPDKIEQLITDKTCAIIPVHVYGNICDVEAIDSIAKKHNLKVIYDAAHTFGEAYKGMGVGNYGDASIFSFHATKVFNSIEGGCVCFSDEEIGKRLYNLKNFGIRDTETVEAVGANAKMNEFQAAMGLCNLRYLNENIEKRRRLVKLYQNLLGDIEGITTWREQNDVDHNYAYFPIIVDENTYGMNRDEVFDLLVKHDIYPRKYFYPLTCDFDAYKGKFDGSHCEVAERISRSVLTLPIYPDLETDVISKIATILKEKR
ncbi:MAG: DegT/DnrJ/EryC1/StrS family aminotransferase [Lachnospiraceae bacterium]|nr:DegT/DnrJ/EryC1/StrS family aminotransferase [Lachnospiraceae bacterium]